ncbi:MAG: PAS domain S-box protein [Methanomicrobiales archaeon]
MLEISPVAREALFRAIPAGVIFIDDRSRIVDTNPAAEMILGIDASTVLGLPATEAISGWPELQEFLESEPSDHRVDIPCHREGTLRYYTVVRTPLPGHRNRDRGAILIIQDITPRKEAEQGMEIARTHIALLNSITRHDILNLVTGASGYLQLAHPDGSLPPRCPPLPAEPGIRHQGDPAGDRIHP